MTTHLPGTPADFAAATTVLASWAEWNARAAACEVDAGGDDWRAAVAREAARSWRTAAAQARAALLDLPGGPELWTLRAQFTYDA